MNSESQTILLLFIGLGFTASIFSMKAKKKEQAFSTNIIASLMYGIPLLSGYITDSNSTLSFICWIYILVAISSHTLLLIIIGAIKLMRK